MADLGYIYLTSEGKQKMTEERDRLLKVERPRIVAEISRARDLGDLSENAEYHAAKEKQVLLERKLSELEEKLPRVRLIDPSDIVGDNAVLLCFVRVRDRKTKEEIRYQLVSPEEADFDEDRISIQAPVGRALLGKSQGDVVKIQVPAGTLTYEILAIERPT